MPVIAKYGGIVLRLMSHRTFGTHVHVFHGDTELVLGLNPVRVIQGDAPSWVREWALEWVGYHQRELFVARKINLDLRGPPSDQTAGALAHAA